jgi:thiol-disulfide isomerase/thioredoxin
MSNSYGNYRNVYNPSVDPELPSESVIPILDINELTDSFETLIQKYKMIVVKIWAPWCEPCKVASKKVNQMINDLVEQYGNMVGINILFLHDNIDHPNSVHREKINVVPTFYIYYTLDGGKSVSQTYFTNLDFPHFVETVHNLYQQVNQPQHTEIHYY